MGQRTLILKNLLQKQKARMMKISKEKAFSIMESLLFMSSEPRPFSDFEALFEGEISSQELKTLIEEFKDSYNKKDRGLHLKKIGKGWQLRTKTENKDHLLKIKAQSLFRLSRPSLEVLSIIAFEQPCTKMEIDEIRGVESGHLLRTLVEKELISLSGKSDLPGKASLYKTSHKFLETFGLENLTELPSQEEIEELLANTKEKNKEDLQSISQEFVQTNIKIPYHQDERENKKIKDSLKSLPDTVEFLEKEKLEKTQADESKQATPSANTSKNSQTHGQNTGER